MDRSDVGLSQYSYDELSQLLTANLPDGDLQTYAFDPVGNRLSLQDHRGLQRYRYDSADQLLDVESDFNPEEPESTPSSLAWASAAMSDASPSRPFFRASYSFDSDGNEIGKTGPGHRSTSYVFSALDRLAGVDSAGSVPERYQYNADGQRVATVKGKGSGAAESERFLRFGRARPVLAEFSGGKLTTRYIVLPGGQLLARVGPVDSNPVFYHFDALGSTVTLVDASARTITRFAYDAYGARRSTPVSTERFGFVGRESVSEEVSGLLEMGFRSDDVALGRFLSRDLPEDSGAVSEWVYIYAMNAPTSMVDPAGLHAIDPEYYASCGASQYQKKPWVYHTGWLNGHRHACSTCPSEITDQPSSDTGGPNPRQRVVRKAISCFVLCLPVKLLFGLKAGAACEAACEALH